MLDPATLFLGCQMLDYSHYRGVGSELTCYTCPYSSNPALELDQIK